MVLVLTRELSLWQQIVQRLKEPNAIPMFFKKVRTFGIYLTTSSVSARVAIAALNDNFPDYFDNILGYLILTGTLMISFSTLTTTNTVLSNAVTPKDIRKENAGNNLPKV